MICACHVIDCLLLAQSFLCVLGGVFQTMLVTSHAMVMVKPQLLLLLVYMTLTWRTSSDTSKGFHPLT
jgi:hypothetical protein